MKKPLLEIENLEIIYKTDLETIYAVNGISFSLEKGKTLGMVGETGAGKTTTARALMRLLPERTARVVNGSIKLDGEEVLTMTSGRLEKIRGKRISMIFQDPMSSLNPIMTIGSQIAEALALHNYSGKSTKDIDKEVNKMLELVGIPAARKNEYPHQFSGGMKQRAMIAIAISCEPELLIADEPTTALDVTIQAQVLLLMRGLRDKLKTSMIMITHDLGIVAMVCDNVAVMYAGEIIEYGTVEDIFENTKHHPYTIGLFGSIPNVLEDSDRLHPIEGLMPDPSKCIQGCKFAPRCPKAHERCFREHPKYYIDGSHKICCNLFDEYGARNAEGE